VAPATKKLLQRAAKAQKNTLTEFVITTAQAAAQNILADQTRFALSPAKWAAFNAALDAPPRDIPALKKLFEKPSVFEDRVCSPRP